MLPVAADPPDGHGRDPGLGSVGLWTRAQRERLRAFYTEHGAEHEIHYLRISPEEWERRIRKRNARQKEEEPSAYFVDEGLLRKVESLFEEPSETEIDRLVEA